MAEERMPVPHKLTLNDRKSLLLSGTAEVVSFDENAVILKTGLGVLSVQGQQLHLKTLSPENGQVAIDGHISALIYEEPRISGGLLGKLFK
ncbi:MAG: sporulation protein YabP [Oscillospiraceae bacterium]|nr:sporulation protein YabP [Oscillospiraceae bacterium]